MKNTLYLSLVLTFNLITSLYATEYSFHGTFSNDYSHSANWENNLAAPTTITATDTVYILSGSSCILYTSLINEGTLFIQGTLTDYVHLQNFGKIFNYQRFVNFGQFSNLGSIWTFSTGSFYNMEYATVWNQGYFFNSGDSCVNAGTFNNDSLVNNTSGVFIHDTTSFSQFNNYGILENNFSGAVFYAAWSMQNDTQGIIRNEGQILNEYPGISVIINDGLIHNDGMMDIYPRYLSNGPESTLSGRGSFNLYSCLIGGTIIPGDTSIGTMTFTSEYACQFTDSTKIILQYEYGTHHDQIIMSVAWLSGIIQISKVEGYDLQYCAPLEFVIFDSLISSSASIAFDSLIASPIVPDLWQPAYTDSSFILYKEPGTYRNKALSFGYSGEESYVTIPYNLGFTQTIEFRYKPETVDPDAPGEMILSLDNSATQYISSNQVSSTISGETLSIVHGASILYTTFPFQKQWYHISVVSDFNDYVQIYVDGIPVPVYLKPGYPFPDVYYVEDIRLGARKPYPQGYTQGFFKGAIDELRFWSTIRDSASIFDHHYKEISPDECALMLAYYPMNQGGGLFNFNQCVDYLEDVSGNNHHGSLIDFTLSGISSNWIISPTCGFQLPEVNRFIGADDNWFHDLNWTLGVPSTCHHVLIPAGKSVLIDRPGAECFMLDIEPGGTLETMTPYVLDVTTEYLD